SLDGAPDKLQLRIRWQLVGADRHLGAGRTMLGRNVEAPDIAVARAGDGNFGPELRGKRCWESISGDQADQQGQRERCAASSPVIVPAQDPRFVVPAQDPRFVVPAQDPRLVVPAKAGTHTPCQSDVAQISNDGDAAEYGSPPSR